ncbi:jg25199 [Pararge aegeria aegeria]|uniref:Jg25199 protein n=1 Tax=Pararge aegeria aegeria TaxID=348720 RepID=A0A8S4RYL3_9NEOP|nr:jg25199 [Pararge aegeria aegeria]
MDSNRFALWDKRAEGKHRFFGTLHNRHEAGARQDGRRVPDLPHVHSPPKVTNAAAHVLPTAFVRPKYSISIKKSALSFTHLRTQLCYSTQEFNTVRVDVSLC